MKPIEDLGSSTWWEIIKWVSMLLLGGGLLFPVLSRFQATRPPTFRVSAINTLDDSNRYEIASNWARGTPVPDLEFNLGLEIFPTYYGPDRGTVRVSVKGGQGQVLGSNSWDEFGKDSRTLSVSLDPYLVALAVDPLDAAYLEENGDYTYPSTQLLVEIVDTSESELLWTDSLWVDNTPWYHFARTSVNYIWAQEVRISVKGQNLGGPSEFFLAVDIYEMTDLDGSPGNPWPWVAGAVKTIDGVVDRGARLSTHFTLPEEVSSGFPFERGKCYAITTILAKKQPYIEPQAGVGWEGWAHMWRFGDWWDTSLVCYPSD